MYTTIFFDGYGTLFDKAFDALYETCQIIVDDLQIDMSKEAFLDHWDRYFFPLLREGDFISFWDAHIIGLEKTFADLNVRANPESYMTGLFDAFGRVPVFCDVRPTIDALSDLSAVTSTTQAGVKTGVISNADHGHLTLALSNNGLSFPVVISSESARCYKPNPDIFFCAFEALGADPDQTLYVGDSQEDDIVGARRAGISVAWLNRDGAMRQDGIPEPDYEISSLSELCNILGEE